jgi:sulfopyruvate decarboxylase subunit alpha
MKPSAVEAVIRGLKRAGVRLVCYLPDSLFKELWPALDNDPDIRTVRVTNEGESAAICGGVFLSGKRAALVMENSGLRASVEPLAHMGPGACIPVVMLMSYRGELGENNWWAIPHGVTMEPVLDALRIPHRVVREAAASSTPAPPARSMSSTRIARRASSPERLKSWSRRSSAAFNRGSSASILTVARKNISSCGMSRRAKASSSRDRASTIDVLSAFTARLRLSRAGRGLGRLRRGAPPCGAHVGGRAADQSGRGDLRCRGDRGSGELGSARQNQNQT